MPTDFLTTALTDMAPPLTPKLAPWMTDALAQPSRLAELIETYGSPVHLLVGQEFKRNVQDLLSPLKARALNGGLFFARKANKLPWFVSLAREVGIGVDTASAEEVRETLALGVDPQRLIITAIGKDKALITRAITSGCLLVLDNEDELLLVRTVCEALGKPARIGLRFSGFDIAGKKQFSRFGFPIEDAARLLQVVADSPLMQLEILHAHLDRYDVGERACAARSLIKLTDRARALGIESINGIDLGGGILMRYLQHEEEWTAFTAALVDAVAGKRPSFTYREDGLGFYRVDSQVHGNADLYPAFNRLSKERFIAAILDHQEAGVAVYKELVDRSLSIFFEPGRALLDNTGMTLAKVSFRKKDTAGNQLVGLAMNRMNLRPFRAEFCNDPLFLPGKSTGIEPLRHTGSNAEKQPAGAFLVGSLCSESDLIYRRRVQIDRLPSLDDIVCFANTSGYLMHHMEIGTHGGPLPANVLIDPQTLDVHDTFGGAAL